MGEPMSEWDRAVSEPVPDPDLGLAGRLGVAAKDTYDRCSWLEEPSRWREVAQRVLVEAGYPRTVTPMGRHELRRSHPEYSEHRE